MHFFFKASHQRGGWKKDAEVIRGLQVDLIGVNQGECIYYENADCRGNMRRAGFDREGETDRERERKIEKRDRQTDRDNRDSLS